jgi:hypothetical protein
VQPRLVAWQSRRCIFIFSSRHDAVSHGVYGLPRRARKDECLGCLTPTKALEIALGLGIPIDFWAFDSRKRGRIGPCSNHSTPALGMPLFKVSVRYRVGFGKFAKVKAL